MNFKVSAEKKFRIKARKNFGSNRQEESLYFLQKEFSIQYFDFDTSISTFYLLLRVLLLCFDA